MRASLDRIGAITAKEFKHLARDPRALALVLLLPIVQLLLFAYAISFDVQHVPTLVIDQDRTPASAEYLRNYEGSTFFSVVGHADSVADATAAFDRNQARVAVVVPAGFGRQLASGAKGQVAVLVDGSEPNSARVAEAYTKALNRLYDQKVAADWADTQGLDLAALGSLQPQIRTWYNPERRSSDFLIPGLMVVIIMIVTVQQTAVTLVRERDQGTGEQMAVSPLRRGELMIGKLLPWTILAFLDVVAIVAVGIGILGVPLRGDPVVLAVAAALFVFACLGLGLVISALAPSVDTASITALLLAFLPSFLLSGFAFALDQIPVVLQWVASAFPARYMVTVSRAVFLKGAGWSEALPEVLSLAVYALVVLMLATLLHSRRSR